MIGTVFPPLTVFYDGSTYWLADGFHRIKAAIEAEVSEVDCNVHNGTRRDAILYSVGANASHGLRRTKEDRHKAVMTLLLDDEWGKWSPLVIAEKCNVGKTLVYELKKSLSVSESDNKVTTYVNKHGNISTMNTGNIGKRKTDFET